MIRRNRFQVERNCRPQGGNAFWIAFSPSVLALVCITLLVPSEAFAQGNKAKSRKSAEKSKEPAAKSTEKESADDELKFTDEQIASAKNKYTSADQAFGVGAAHYNSRNFAASREPFEAALILAPGKDAAYRIKVYRALTASYRQLENIDPFIQASEYVIRHSDRAAEQSLTRDSLLAFITERVKLEPFIQRHEERLKKDPKDRLSVYLLSEVYLSVRVNPERATELLNQLATLDGKKAGEPADVNASAKLAAQYVRAKEYQKGAELFEQIAPLDKRQEAWHWKEAAQAWLKLKQKEKALAAAKKAVEIGPDKRSDLLAHYWHRHLGDVFLAVDEPKLAIPQYEMAIETTKIEGYIKDCKGSLAEAREKAAK